MRDSEVHSFFEFLLRSRVVAARQEIARLRSGPRLSDPRRLEHFGFRAFSQNDEDGIIAEVFARIGTTNRIFLEIGAGDGLNNNTAYLLAQGWTGAWIDADKRNIDKIEHTFAGPIREKKVRAKHSFVTRDNVNAIVASLNLSGDIDLASIDIDGNDYYVLEALEQVKPRVIVIEYNAVFRPPVSWVQAYDPKHVWDEKSNAYGASLTALTKLAETLGYSLVGCNMTGVNAFYVLSDFADERFAGPFTSETFFAEPAFELEDAFRSGHRTGWIRSILP